MAVLALSIDALLTATILVGGLEHRGICFDRLAVIVGVSLERITQLCELVCVNAVFEVSHQFAHSVLAQHESPFASALTLSYDGGGDDGCFNVFVSNRTSWPVQVYYRPICPGAVYAVLGLLVPEVHVSGESCKSVWMTHFLAIAGKVMAYASLGKENPELTGLMRDFMENWERELPYSKCEQYAPELQNMQRIAGLNRSHGGLFASVEPPVGAVERSAASAGGATLAASIQRMLEGLTTETLTPFLERYADSVEGIAIVGGCALNVRVNQLVAELAATYGLPTYVPAAPNDAGIIVGAIWALDPPSNRPSSLAYAGPLLFDTARLDEFVHARGATKTDPSQLATHFALGHVIAVARGRTGSFQCYACLLKHRNEHRCVSM